MSVEQQQYLSDLVKHPGWLIFREHCRKQWGAEGYGRKMKQAIGNAKATDLAVIVHGIDVANDEINALLTWPDLMAEKVADTTPTPVRLQRGGA